jgi:hypothetical protein
MIEVQPTTDGRRQVWKDVFETNFRPYPGGVLAFFGGIQRLTEFGASYDFVMRHVVDGATEKCPYGNFVHLWPGLLDYRDIPSELREAVNADAAQDGVPREQIDRYLASISFARVDTCDGQDLQTALGNTPSGSSVYVHCADLYRFADVRFAPRASRHPVDGLPMSMTVVEDVASGHADHRPVLQDALDGGRLDPNHQVDPGDPADLPQAG